MSQELKLLLREARDTIDSLPGYPKGADLCDRIDAALARTHQPEAAPQVVREWPKLTQPATVGAATFGVGVSAKHVVEAAQRQHEYKQEQPKLTREQAQEQERNRRELWDMLHGSPEPLAQQPAQVVPEGFVLVPVEPTDGMLEAGALAHEASPCHDIIGPISDAWAALLAASQHGESAE